MFKEKENTLEADEREIATALQSLRSPAFKSRFISTDSNPSDPEWIMDGLPVDAHVKSLVGKYKNEIEGNHLKDFHTSSFEKFNASTLITSAHHRLYPPVIPAPRDLFHVYGPDKDNTRDRERYYAYAWKDEGPHAIMYSDDIMIIRQGALECNSYSYSGQNSYALVGAGLFFTPKYGASRISIRPYVQWQTYASFTGVSGPMASATANIGIYVESWKTGNSEVLNESDIWVQLWHRNTGQYTAANTAGGTATVMDGLTCNVNTIPQRKYAIYVYAWIETSAGPQEQKNEYRFVTLDIEAKVPYVVVEEKLL